MKCTDCKIGNLYIEEIQIYNKKSLFKRKAHLCDFCEEVFFLNDQDEKDFYLFLSKNKEDN